MVRVFLILIILTSGLFFVPYQPLPRAEPGNGGLFLPDGFEAVVVVDSLPARARHIAISEVGDIYVKGNRYAEGGANFVLRDLDKDGKADSIRSRPTAFNTSMSALRFFARH